MTKNEKHTMLRFLNQHIRRRAILLHVLSWGLFIAYELIFIYYAQQKFTTVSILKFPLYYAVNIGVFYSLLNLLNGPVLQKRGYLKGLSLFLLQFLLLTFAKAVLDILFTSPLSSFKEMTAIVRANFFADTFRSIYFCILATFYWVAGNIAGYRKKAAHSEKKQLIALKDKAELEQRLAETRNAYLQQQLNPHLLFNSLSFIHSSVYAHSADASRCVLLLSDIMRFSMDSTSSDGKTMLSAEVEQVANLIELNRYRFGGELCLQTSLEAYGDDLRIIPLVLLTLTENLFKHGFVTDPAHPALLEIHADGKGLLTYRSRNRTKIKSRTPQRGGLGLQNTRIRLDHSYPGAYELNMSEDEHNFELTLTLQL